MRFRNLRGLTSLPIERILRQFRNESVVTVLPVSDEGGGRDSILVATPSALALVTGDAGPRSDHWMTQWAPWDVVRLTDEAEAMPEPDVNADEEYRLTVLVGGRRFAARIRGELGRKALRDFVVAVQSRRATLTPNP